MQRVEKLDTLHKGQQPRTAAAAACRRPTGPQARLLGRRPALPNAAISPCVCPGCGARIMRRALDGACILRPLPLLRLAASAAGGARLRSPSTKFYGKSRTRHFVPRTQFAVKFPWWCRRRRRMSADGDGFYTFRQSEQRLLRCLTLEYTMHKVFQGFAPCIRYLLANFPALWIYQIRPGVVLQRALAGC